MPYADVLAATNPATIMNADPEAPLVAVAPESFLGPSAAMLRGQYEEHLLALYDKVLVGQSSRMQSSWRSWNAMCSWRRLLRAAVVVSLFDSATLLALPDSLALAL